MTNPSDSMNLKKADQAHRLRVTRLMLGLTEEQTAAEFGVSLRTYRKYEAGHIPWRGRWAEDFCRKHDVSHCWLWHGEAYGIPRAKNHIAILPAETVRNRNSHITEQVMRLLPKNERDARAILEWAMSLVGLPYHMAGGSDVVPFPKRPPAA